MRKIINNKIYNTKTATELAHYEDGCGYSHWRERLYVTKKGNYFLCGSGGASSKYAVALSYNSWGSSSDINAITPEAAYKWCVDYNEVDLVEERFAEFVEAA